MEQTFPAYFATALLALTIINTSHSQNPDNAPQPMPPVSEYTWDSDEVYDSSSTIRSNEINTRAVRDFMSQYENVSGERWFKLNDGFIVYFTQNEIKIKIAYNKKGVRLWTHRSYKEDRLPFEIRHLVKSNYYDFSIYHVNEITINRKIAYFVKMQDKTSWLTVKVEDGEMEVTENYIKS
ncbi:MAG: hypothetical protein ACHQFX_16945 [Chitinophagales bacterium]